MSENALKYADQVANALRGKFPDHSIYVRLIEAPGLNHVEIAAKNKKNNEEVTVAYGVPFFEEMVDAKVKQARATRIFSDVKVHMGIHE